MGQYSIDMKQSGKNLRRLRGNKSIATVAAALGISPSALDMYERGERIPRDQIKVRICNYYNKSPLNIFFMRNTHGS